MQRSPTAPGRRPKTADHIPQPGWTGIVHIHRPRLAASSDSLSLSLSLSRARARAVSLSSSVCLSPCLSLDPSLRLASIAQPPRQSTLSRYSLRPAAQSAPSDEEQLSPASRLHAPGSGSAAGCRQARGLTAHSTHPSPAGRPSVPPNGCSTPLLPSGERWSQFCHAEPARRAVCIDRQPPPAVLHHRRQRGCHSLPPTPHPATAAARVKASGYSAVADAPAGAEERPTGRAPSCPPSTCAGRGA